MNERTRAHFEAIGIEGVLSEIAEGKFGAGPSLAKSEAEAWVAAERVKRDGAALSRKEAREEETLSIARKALSNAQRATTIAIFAVIVSIAMAAQKARRMALTLNTPAPNGRLQATRMNPRAPEPGR